MTQEAVVTRVLPHRMAEVAVTRKTACGGNCGSCESCLFQSEMKTMAYNRCEASLGQRVLIETQSSRIYGAALLVYIVPLICFLAGYAAAYLFGLTEGGCVAVSFASLIMGSALIVSLQKKKKPDEEIRFEIVSLLE